MVIFSGSEYIDVFEQSHFQKKDKTRCEFSGLLIFPLANCLGWQASPAAGTERQIRSVVIDRRITQGMRGKNVYAWDYQFGFSQIINSGLDIIPSTNLVTNIGFGEGATNTHDKQSKAANVKSDSSDISIGSSVGHHR